jgi:hypothetical protein
MGNTLKDSDTRRRRIKHLSETIQTVRRQPVPNREAVLIETFKEAIQLASAEGLVVESAFM